MKFLNAAVAVGLIVALAFALNEKTPPPRDPWFQSSVVDYPRPVLVKFGAEWCPPCRHMEGILDRAENELSGRVKIVRIDIDRQPDLAQHYGVRSIPRLFLFDHGQIVASHGGFADADDLVNWVNRNSQ